MSHSRQSLQDIFESHIQSLALSLRPDTVSQYRTVSRCFLSYLHGAFPQVRRLSQLRRDPHLLGWFRWLCDRQPPLCNATRCNYLIALRRLLHDLAANGDPVQPALILVQDLPPLPRYLPRALSLQNDHLLQQELRRTDDLPTQALLLMRATGIRIGECIDLAVDCLRQLGPNQWALHVPLGKLHTERLMPVDQEVRQVVARILALRADASLDSLARSEGLLLPRSAARSAFYITLTRALADAAQRAGCSGHLTSHQLRHTWASEMLRLGVSLPALMQLLGHKDIRMTLRYLQVTQQDLQREFHLARQNAAQPHLLPQLPVPCATASLTADLTGIRQALAATRHLLEMFRRQLRDEDMHRKLQRLDKRLLSVASELDRLATDLN
jgi:site-specific recombinase XerD